MFFKCNEGSHESGEKISQSNEIARTVWIRDGRADEAKSLKKTVEQDFETGIFPQFGQMRPMQRVQIRGWKMGEGEKEQTKKSGIRVSFIGIFE